MQQVKAVIARSKGAPVTVETINVPDPGPGEAEILDCLRWPDVHLLAEPPSRRRSSSSFS